MIELDNQYPKVSKYNSSEPNKSTKYNCGYLNSCLVGVINPYVQYVHNGGQQTIIDLKRLKMLNIRTSLYGTVLFTMEAKNM